ncbi:MAG: hypothetical protein HC840_00025 [Leptolyngbyaceae cyanobacterium RM2_2_4]|nr:hypothetical protein [Leptolyngbyaceae cyanobacterium RM2_2_4]
MSKSSTEEQVREMAKLTLLTNKLNPIQEKNLKLYPLVFFNGVKSAKMDFDLSNDQMIESVEDRKELEITYQFNKAETKHLRVSYHLEIDESADNSSLDKRFEAIEMSVRNLLWLEIKVQVFINTKLAYESKDV